MSPHVPAKAIRLGYVPLNDCAPVVVAHEMGLFQKYDLTVKICREPGWATIRDKFYHCQLEAAQSIAGLAFLLATETDQRKRDVTVPLYLSAQGNAITLSNRLPLELIKNGNGLSQFASDWKQHRPITFAATHRYSSHHLLLHQWLRRNRVFPNRDPIEIIFLPPPVMASTLRSGHIDGYCVGEPWNSLTTETGEGWCPAVSSDISFGHPEKVLLMNNYFINNRKNEAIRLCAALLEACEYCQNIENHSNIVEILSLKQYIGVDKSILKKGYNHSFSYYGGLSEVSDFHLFYGDEINRPSSDKTSWLISGLRAIGAIRDADFSSLSRVFRDDYYDEAVACKLT